MKPVYAKDVVVGQHIFNGDALPRYRWVRVTKIHTLTNTFGEPIVVIQTRRFDWWKHPDEAVTVLEG